MIDKATVKRIIEAADIVDVVGDYVHLTKRGSNYMGLCPFHNEKTPSFSVSRSRNICHCFSCGKGGSPVNFIMEKEGINYHDALLRLAQKYGIKVEEKELSDDERREQSERESMLITNDWAMKKMHSDIMNTSEGQDVGLQYLYQRRITKSAIEKFKLGYAIDSSNELYNAALKKGFNIDILRSVGLCGVSSQGQNYDRFRGRVIFPVINSAGKVVAFGGRGIKGEKAKYINSPESLIYKKSNELYGIYQARNSIVRNNKCYLVEGYLDVIGMWQSGLENVVASSGTSLTDGQIALIHRFTDNITLIYDGDPAGIKASLRGIDLLLLHNMNIKVVLLPDGDDPDSFSHKHTPEDFQKYIYDNEIDFIEFKTKTLLDMTSSNPQDRASAIHSIVLSLGSISDMIKRALYVQECSRMLGISEDMLVLEVGKVRNEVVENQKKQRERARLESHYPIDDKPLQQSDGVDKSSKSILTNEISKATKNSLAPLEKNVLEYCIKYGMITFFITEDGVSQNVTEYVDSEMKSDKIDFSVERYRKTFMRILGLSEKYRIAEKEYASRIDKIQSEQMQKWYDEMSHDYHSVEELDAKEKEVYERFTIEKEADIQEFAIRYISDELGSDEDDDIRSIVLETIIPKYKLSKYHTKSVKIVTDLDRLSDLVPRALCEWKDGIISERFRSTQEQLRQAVFENNSEKITNLIATLQQLSELRCLVSKSIGDRIIKPMSKGRY